MIGQGKVVGLILILIGLILSTVVGLWLVFNVAEGKLQPAAFILGLAGVLLVFFVPLVGAQGWPE